MNAEKFKEDMRRAIKTAIARLDSGTVGIGDDCLWGMAVRHLSHVNGPTGVNAPWVARQTFNEVIKEPAFARFVYDQKAAK